MQMKLREPGGGRRDKRSTSCKSWGVPAYVPPTQVDGEPNRPIALFAWTESVCKEFRGDSSQQVHAAFLNPWWASSRLSMITCEELASRSADDHLTGSAQSSCQAQALSPCSFCSRIQTFFRWISPSD